MIRSLLLFLALVLSSIASATHNRAGEIIICHVSGLIYQVTIITHTQISSPADRPELILDWGDGTPLETIARTDSLDNVPLDLRRNEYVATHSYSGPGVFTLSFEDPNRIGGLVNMDTSIQQPFCVKTQITVGTQTGNNCSVRFANPPIQNACVGQPWIHNPGAFDPDGDSLSFEPAICLGPGCEPISSYQYPNAFPAGGGNSYTIDPLTGTISWLNPMTIGRYNIAFIVREWRRENGVLHNVGWVMRDMEITVYFCDNVPPTVSQVADTCVVANTLLSFAVQASDPDAGQSVVLNALGQPFLLTNSPASFLSPSPGNPVNGVFNWNTNCSHVRLQPYQVVFNAIDNGDVPLQNYSSMNIRVIAPRPENPLAVPSSNGIALSWDPSVCSNATGYLIYRRSGLYGFVPGYCETDVPGYTGYVEIASVDGVGNNSYVDQGDLVFGNQYCYMVVARFADGSRSIASEEFCAILDRQVPVITHVSVGVTDVSNGIDTVRWSNAYDLDTIARPGPYQFRLYRGIGQSSATELIWTSSVHPFLAHPDTQFLDTGLNTQDQGHVYRVELLGDGGNELIGSSNVASSVFINAVPNDEQLTIQWTLNTPWVNSLYEVFRFDGSDWLLIGSSNTESYVDTGLVNGTEYCYYVRSTGAYSDPVIVSPLINYSQEVCGVPIDLTPPCVPELSLDNDCELPLNTLSWTNPANACGDLDTYAYNIWFSDSLGGEFVLIGTNEGAWDTLFAHTDGASVAGCYAVSAIDSVGNESALSIIACGDNCPEYTLPNVFTPNSDGVNDLFVPFPYRGVKEIDLQVFNRWGQLVFGTTDPAIQWNGTHQDNGETLSDGVYYYVCHVIFVRLAGDEVITLKGYVHLLGGGSPQRRF